MRAGAAAPIGDPSIAAISEVAGSTSLPLPRVSGYEHGRAAHFFTNQRIARVIARGSGLEPDIAHASVCLAHAKSLQYN